MRDPEVIVDVLHIIEISNALALWMLESSTRIKDAGIAIRHSRGRILFYTAWSGNALEGVGVVFVLDNGLTTH